MKKNWLYPGISPAVYEMLTKMKLTIFLICITVLGSFAADSYAQTTRLTLDVENATIKSILSKIESQSEFKFFYSSNVDVDQTASISQKNKKVFDILNDLFEGTGIKYEVYGRQIALLENGETFTFPTTESVAQQKSVSGTVTDESGQPLPGVTVSIKGTTQGTVTNTDGNYSLTNIPENATLVFSFVGIKTQEIAVGDQTTINVAMEVDAIGIEDVIVIGYGTALRKDYTGSVSSVKMEGSPVSLIPNLNALESLKGNVAGLNIGPVATAGGEPSMLIRGQNSISGSNNPLIVLDGIIYMGSLGDINPNDIATYDILKDAVSASVYGSRSANGVIAITTKKGRTGKPVITFDASGAVQTWQRKPQLMEGEEWFNVSNIRKGNNPGETGWLPAYNLMDNYNAGKETDWLDMATRTGVVQDYQVSVSGGAEKINYYFSSSYNDNKGILVGDDFNRITLLGKLNTDITSWLKVGWSAGYSRNDYSGVAADLGQIVNSTPYGTAYRDDQGNLEKYPYTQSGVNVLWGINDGTRDDENYSNDFNLNAYALIDIPWVKGLNFKTNILSLLSNGFTGNFIYENYYVSEGVGLERYSPATVSKFLSSANGSISNTKTNSYVFDNILSYKNTFQKHTVEATLVATRDERRYQIVTTTGSDFAANGSTTLGFWGLHKATVQKVNLNVDERANVGYLARLNYSFNNKYYFTSSYRYDGASVFGDNRKWASFAAFGAAWRISNEDFLKDFKPLNNLKIKLSWGQNGNQGIGPYATLSQISNGPAANMRYEFGNVPGAISYGMFQSTMGNSDLGWEKNSSWNTGFESSWLNNRLSVDLDIYSSKTTDQIFRRNIPVMTGFQTVLASMGQINNVGFELTLNSTNVSTKDVQWNTFVTCWMNRNKLVSLYGEDKNGDGIEDDDVANSLFIGKSLGAIYNFEQIGIVQQEDTEYIALTGSLPGYPKYKDIDGKPGITPDDRKILGYTKENFRLNMGNTVKYKNFELYALLAGIFGGNGYFLKSNKEAYTVSYGWMYQNKAGIPYWTPENKSNVYPSPTFNQRDARYSALQSRGFVRLQDVSLSYSLKSDWIKAARISSMKIFFSAKNMATITVWEGSDPESGSTLFQNPIPSTWSIGANISF
jgi:TonB-dependent starch-binding outer membrane protein SusC